EILLKHGSFHVARRFGGGIAAVAALLAVGSGAAQAANPVTMFSSMEGVPTVQGINSAAVGPYQGINYRTAMAFSPTVSGTASLLLMHGQCVIPYPAGTTCQAIGQVEIQTDSGGHPSGTVLGSMGFYLADSVTTGQPVQKECGTLSPAPTLNAGTRYWAVMTSPDFIGWNFWTNAASTVLESDNNGAWFVPPTTKTLALKLVSGPNSCLGVAT